MSAPYAFTGPYRDCYCDPKQAMDARHVYMIHSLLMAAPFGTVAEIGCLHGSSSTAIVEAMNAGRDFNATFCDVEIQDSLRSVLGNCKYPERVRVPHELSWNLLASEYFDFVLVDASHELVPVSLEVGTLLMQRPNCIVAHDTSATENGLARCEGAKFLKETFLQMPDYQCIEDNEKRPDETTERGLFIASRTNEIHEMAVAVVKRWQAWER